MITIIAFILAIVMFVLAWKRRADTIYFRRWLRLGIVLLLVALLVFFDEYMVITTT